MLSGVRRSRSVIADAILPRSSPAAARVNVITTKRSMLAGTVFGSRGSMYSMSLSVSTRVFPLPAPADTRTLLPRHSIEFSCEGVKSISASGIDSASVSDTELYQCSQSIMVLNLLRQNPSDPGYSRLRHPADFESSGWLRRSRLLQNGRPEDRGSSGTHCRSPTSRRGLHLLFRRQPFRPFPAGTVPPGTAEYSADPCSQMDFLCRISAAYTVFRYRVPMLKQQRDQIESTRCGVFPSFALLFLPPHPAVV